MDRNERVQGWSVWRIVQVCNICKKSDFEDQPQPGNGKFIHSLHERIEDLHTRVKRVF